MAVHLPLWRAARPAKMDWAPAPHTLAARRPRPPALPSMAWADCSHRTFLEATPLVPHRWPAVAARSSSPQSGASPSQEEEQEEAEGEWCAPAFISVDNRKNPNFTVLELEVLDYPGLVRVIAWVLNGMDLVAQNAVLSTSAEGLAYNTFWLSTRAGKKLKDADAELALDRLRQFVTFCSPKADDTARTDHAVGPISVSNSEHELYTVVVMRERERTPGFLLEVASVLAGLNVQVLQGIIQGCTDCGDDVPTLTTNLAGGNGGTGGRLLKFWVRNMEGEKLNSMHCRSLLYALGTALGFSSQRFPLRPPYHEDA